MNQRRDGWLHQCSMECVLLYVLIAPHIANDLAGQVYDPHDCEMNSVSIELTT